LSRYHDGGGAIRIARANDETANQGLANPIEMCERGRSRYHHVDEGLENTRVIGNNKNTLSTTHIMR
jgi:hypothetical protein